MYNQGAQAYLRTQQTTASPRELEASLLTKAAAKLQSARDDAGMARLPLDEAIGYNRRLWTILSTSATRPENPLPRDVKDNIAQRAVFIFTHSMNILADPRPEKMASLIAINAHIAAGLRGSMGE